MTRATDIAIAGGAAEGRGVIGGFRGLGKLSQPQRVQALIDAGCPSDWATSRKSEVGYAGEVLARLNQLGYIARRAGRSNWANNETGKTREYRARWYVGRSLAATAEVGDSMGPVVVTAELRDGSPELHLTGDAHLCATIRADYDANLGAELYTAGEITQWVSGLLINKCGACRFGVGFYIPSHGKELAARIVNAVASRWGSNWINPLLPVATTEELKLGIARGFQSEISRVGRSLQTARETARKDNQPEISVSTAARLLKDLADVDSRADAYRVLCGDEALTEAGVELARLHTELSQLSGDTATRFAMLELDTQPSAAVETTPAQSPAETAAEKALAERRSETTAGDMRTEYRKLREASGLNSVAFKAECIAKLPSGIAPSNATPADWIVAARLVNAPTQPKSPLEPHDAAGRFDMIELE